VSDRCTASATRSRSSGRAKTSKATYRGCDHQCVQDIYAGAIVPAKTFAKTEVMYDIVSEISASESDGTCGSPWAKQATTAMAAQHPVIRENYDPKTL
jgi:hypothetical protein